MKSWRIMLWAIMPVFMLSQRAMASAWVEWTSAPSEAAHNSYYYSEVHGASDNGTLSQVNIYKEWVPFAFAGGGDGWNGWSGNPSIDGGEQYITYMGEAVDSD